MRLDKIRLLNFNCFKERLLELAPRFNLIVGDNATGKTTLLNGMAVGLGALFLGFPSPAEARSIDREEARLEFFQLGDSPTSERQFPVQVSCSGVVDGKEIIWQRELRSEEGRTTRQVATLIENVANELKKKVKSGTEALLPVLSFYGTGRLWVQKRQREIKTLKPDSRFMGYLDCLKPASDVKRLLEWFKTQEISAIQAGIPNNTLEACRRAILSCVPDATKVFFDIKRDQLTIELPGRSLPFSYLSDGFRSMLAMVADIAVRCATLNPHLQDKAAEETTGVVLIDELDLHLHPKWQRRVIGDLLKAFPKIQFVGTTHSPFVIQSLPPGDGMKLINLDNPDANEFVNKSVEDITEGVQGVDIPQRSKRWMDMMEAAKRYFALLQQSNHDDVNKETIQRLRNELNELSLPFSDDPAFQALLHSEREASGIDKDVE